MHSGTKTCLYCQEPLKGRADKKFCDDQCRSNYNYQLNRETNLNIKKVNQILKKNRNILEEILGKEKTKKVAVRTLLEKGYHQRFFTHTLQTQKGIYKFCYEYGYIEMEDRMVLVVKNTGLLK